MSFADEVERVWPGRGATFEVLGGGITNHNLKVEVELGFDDLRIAPVEICLLRKEKTQVLLVAVATGVVDPCRSRRAVRQWKQR